jgi:hypothetical protein
VLTKGLGRFGRAQCLWCVNLDAEAARLALDRRGTQLHAAPRRLRRAGVDRNNLMTVPDDLEQGRDCEVGRSHENATHRGLSGFRLCRFANAQCTAR